MTAYRNEALHVSYSYPAAFTDASAVLGPALEAGMGQSKLGSKNCITLPFSAMNAAKGLEVVLIARADAGCLKRKFTADQLPGFTADEVGELSAAGAHPQFGSPVAFTLDGRNAEALRGSFDLPTGQHLQALVACVLLKPDVACWQFLASSEESLRTMSAFPVSLDGRPSVPLVSPNVFAKP